MPFPPDQSQNFRFVWTEGKKSFNNWSLHAIGDAPNPYEKAISIIGKTLSPFDEDNLIPCFGFGDCKWLLPPKLETNSNSMFSFISDLDHQTDSTFTPLCHLLATTHDQEVFSFHTDHSPCHGFEEVLTCYKRIVPTLRLSGWCNLN